MPKLCDHLTAISDIRQPKQRVCEACVKTKSQWVHLRTCQTCGATLCCDSSPNRHATHHHHESGHPVVISAEIGEQWLWCFKDEQMAAY